VELRSRSRVRRDFRGRLQIHRAASQSRINLYSIVVGQRCAAADLFLGAPLVSPHAWTHLSDRIRVSLGASGWTCWQQRNIAGKSVSPCSSTATWTRRLFSLANALLVRLKQRLSIFPLRWRRCSFVASDFRNRTGAFTRSAFCLLSVAHDRWTSVSQFSMGCSPAGNRFFVDLYCAMATMAAGVVMVAGVSDPGYSVSSFTGGFVFAQVPSLQTNAHVRRREVDQRRRFLGLAESLVSLERADGT